jgi:hypothetical protein
VKIEVLNQRKRSIDEFADKVDEEKAQNGDETQSDKSKDEDTNNLFAGMMNVDNVLAEKAKKKEDKQKKVQQIMLNKERMKPFVMFSGIKDNPIPYE